jgi:hypothetical protein
MAYEIHNFLMGRKNCSTLKTPIVFNYFAAVLSELKIECLDGRRKAVKKMYQDNMLAYVQDYMGRPLEKIHVSIC